MLAGGALPVCDGNQHQLLRLYIRLDGMAMAKLTDHILMTQNAIDETLLRFAKNSLKSGVWHIIPRVSLTDMEELAPALAECEPWTTCTGVTNREAKLDLDLYRRFHHWEDDAFGLGRRDSRGDTFFILGVAVRHITPPIGSIKSPAIKLKCEVQSLTHTTTHNHTNTK